jgi:SpoVK/Ycf46/Vps4 family AAA+-type ATPase
MTIGNGGGSVWSSLFLQPFPARTPLSEVEQLRERCTYLEGRVQQLAEEGPTGLAIIARVDPPGPKRKCVVCFTSGGTFEVHHPNVPVNAGDVVRVMQKNGQILGISDFPFIGPVAEVQQVIEGPGDLVEIEFGHQRRVTRLVGVKAERGDRVMMNGDLAFAFRNIGKQIEDATGPVATVRQAIDEGSIEVEKADGRRTVRRGNGLPEVKKGDRVILDAAQGVAVRLLPRQEDSLAFSGDTGVTWADVKGQEEAVRALREAIEEPWKEKDVYAAFDQSPSKGVLLSGPPGTGKTLLGRAAATAIADLHGKKAAASGYAYVKGPEIMDKWIGSSEANVRRIFTNAREHFAEHGYPQLVFIDECESVLMARTRRESHGGNADVSIVQAFLAELDGLQATDAVFLLATNRPQDIDPAVLRDGRISVSVEMRRPDQKASVEVLRHHFGKKKKLELGRQEMAEKVAALVFDQRHVLGMVRTADRHRFTLGHCATGALLEGIVRKATQIAIRRCIADKAAPKKLLLADFEEAVVVAVKEAQQKGFAEAVADFIAKLPDGAGATWIPANVKEESKIALVR